MSKHEIIIQYTKIALFIAGIAYVVWRAETAIDLLRKCVG